MNFLNIFIIFAILGFFIFSIIFFIKRYKDNNHHIANISNDNSYKLKAELEEDIRNKKELELSKLKKGDINTINEVVERIFKSSKFVAWVKDKNYNISNQAKNMFLSLVLYESEEIIAKTKEVILKDGQTYTQNKHELAIRKEYSEKIFNCVYKAIEEVFNDIPTIYKIFINEYIIIENDYKKLIINIVVNRDQYNTMKNSNNSIIEKLDYFNANYSFDKKEFIFSEIKEEEIPSDFQLAKTMILKADKNTMFYGNTMLLDNETVKTTKDNNTKIINTQISSDTKISNLSGNSIILDKTLILDKNLILNEDNNIENILNKLNYLILSKEELNNGDKSFKVKDKDDNTILINFNNDKEKIIKEENIRLLFGKMIIDSIEKGIFITNSNFSLDAFEFASKNNIELFDNKKINKLI